MKTALLTGLLTATATVAGMIATVAPASAFSWNNSWTQPTVYSKSQTKFNDAPFQPFVQGERIELTGANQVMLDPNKLMMKYAHDVSIYFINEGAGFRNQLAYESTSKDGVKNSNLVFGDIASTESILTEADGPLKKGDGVKLGNMAAGTQLDFWLRANGASRQKNIMDLEAKAAELQALSVTQTADAAKYQSEAQQLQLDADAKKAAVAAATTPKAKAAAQKLADAAQKAATQRQSLADKTLAASLANAAGAQKRLTDAANATNTFGTQTASNGDGLQHVVAYAYKNYILMGFEDLWGEKGATGGKNQSSDRDFNDTVFVLDIGEGNVRNLIKPVPEPTMTLGLIGVGAAAVVMRRRRQTAEQA
jgi:Domain of unknown function (DUF4114)/PEP-CTERM motif